MFRKVVMADKKEILDLIKDVWDGTDYIGNVFDGWIMEPFGEFTCMILDDRIVAVSKMTQLNSECVWFEGLRVDSSYRKRGLGKAFLEYQIKRAIELGYKNVQLSTYYENLSIKIIEAFGFKKIEEFKLNEITIDKEESNLDLKKVLKLKTYQPTRKYYFFDFSFFEVENILLEELIAIGDVYQYKNSSIILTAYKAKGNFLSLVDFTGDYEEVYEFCIERAREMKVEAIVSVSQDDEFIRFMKQKKEVNTSNDELRDVYLYEMDLEDEKMLNREVINDILFEALHLGGDFAEVFIEDRKNTTFQMISGRLEKGLKGNDFGIGIRIYFGMNSVYTYTNDLDKENVIKMLRQAVYEKKENRQIEVMPFQSIDKLNAHHINRQLKSKDKDKVALMLNASQAAKGYCEEISQVIVNYLDYKQDVLIANTEGLLIEDTRVRTRLAISATAQYQNDIQTGSMNRGGHQDFSFYDQLDVSEMGKEAARIATKMVHAKYAPSGKMPVVLGNSFGGVLFHEASGHGLEATSVAKGISVYSNKIGEKVASELVTAIDDGTIINAWGSQNIDDEGNPTQKNVLIEKGILKSYLVDRLNGRIMNQSSTGSGRRQSYKFAPTSRMTNTYIDRGDSKFEDIISSTESGLYAKYLGGGSVNPATGEFNFSVMEGYMIRNGVIEEPVRGATLIGTGFEVLNNVDAASSDLGHGQGMCGSMSGSIPVNVGQPTLRVKSMTVGGRSE